ncbi:hypothetical protein QFZ41_000467 [Luteibacter sp. W1I16]
MHTTGQFLGPRRHARCDASVCCVINLLDEVTKLTDGGRRTIAQRQKSDSAPHHFDPRQYASRSSGDAQKPLAPGWRRRTTQPGHQCFALHARRLKADSVLRVEVDKQDPKPLRWVAHILSSQRNRPSASGCGPNDRRKTKNLVCSLSLAGVRHLPAPAALSLPGAHLVSRLAPTSTPSSLTPRKKVPPADMVTAATLVAWIDVQEPSAFFLNAPQSMDAATSCGNALGPSFALMVTPCELASANAMNNMMISDLSEQFD